MPTSEIRAVVDAVYAQQVDAEMGTGRYALLFKPGVYGSSADPLIVRVGYYTEGAGLGASPGDVTINGHVDVYNRCLAPDNCIALSTISGARCPTSPSTSPGRRTAARRPTSGPCPRPPRCAGSTCAAAT
jgi:hypothetical protein